MPQFDPPVTIEAVACVESSSEGWAVVFAEALADEHARVREFLAAYGRRLRGAQEGLAAELERIVDEGADRVDSSAAQIERLRNDCLSLAAERNALAERLAAADRRAVDLEGRLSREEERHAQPRPEDTVAADLQRRYEMALDDVRELKARNQALESQLRGGRTVAGGPAASEGRLDWESQKRRILAALEAESSQEAPEPASRHLEIHKVVEMTDEVVRRKELEIADLRQVLQGQSRSIGTVAVGAAALEEVFDKDPIIQEQRERLRCLEQQWEDKLRSAEMEISLERAKLARQRVEIEEKLRKLHSADAACVKPDESDVADKQAHGRWKSWLGLKDGPEP